MNSRLFALSLVFLLTCSQTSSDEPSRGPDPGAERPRVGTRLREWWIHRTRTRIQPTDPSQSHRQSAPGDTARVQFPIQPADPTSLLVAGGVGANSVPDPG